MSEYDPRTEPLREWNRLARENTENAIISSMLSAGSLAISPIEKFSTWLLVGTTFILSFLITNANHLLPIIGQSGFRVLGALLCASCLFGLLSRIYALKCTIQSAVVEAVARTFNEHLEAYKTEENKIKVNAEFWGINLETGVRMDRILKEFFKPFPKVTVWLATRHMNRHKDDPQVAYLLLAKGLTRQGGFAFLQILTFFAFFVFGIAYVSSI